MIKSIFGVSNDFGKKVKLHNTSVKSIFGITDFLYCKDILKNYIFQWRYVASV